MGLAQACPNWIYHRVKYVYVYFYATFGSFVIIYFTLQRMQLLKIVLITTSGVDLSPTHWCFAIATM